MEIDNCGIQVDTEGRRLSFGFSNGMKTMEPGLSNPIAVRTSQKMQIALPRALLCQRLVLSPRHLQRTKS